MCHHNLLVFLIETLQEDESEEVESLVNATLHYSWHYVKCPKENECSNGHHNCAKDSEICVDLDDGYECRCGDGYKAGVSGCEPVCSQGSYLNCFCYNFFKG